MIRFDHERLKKLRNKKGMTCNKVGIELKTSGAHVKMWEEGVARMNIENFERVCNFYNVDPGYFFVKESARKQAR